ncbi:MAG TPA: hypothetical protein VL651_04120 [Bacteroidia bacterium]|jgi:hypothetical protein|nr:hypothetical protein [Bacteroidia bacterium]
MKTKKIARFSGLLSVFLLANLTALTQSNNVNFWAKNGNAVVGNGNNFGTFYNSPINVYTNGVNTAEFTVNNGFGTGDGLLIYNPSAPGFDLDMWADNGASLGTHIRWGGSGLIEGANSRFEINGNYNGLAFFARQTTFPAGGLSIPRIIFYMQPVQNGAVI